MANDCDTVGKNKRGKIIAATLNIEINQEDKYRDKKKKKIKHFYNTGICGLESTFFITTKLNYIVLNRTLQFYN